VNLEDYEKLNPRCIVEHEGRRIVYSTPTLGTKWRVDTLFSKEPVTIEWIGGFAPGAVLVDVGANVGMYTVWAAATRQTRVFAFEPEAQNFALLNRNIVLNGIGDRVRAWCLALSDHTGPGELHLSEFMLGGSCHSLDERVDHLLRPRRPAYTQGSYATTLDDLVAAGRVPVPDHVKIDVDGFEPRVIAGAMTTLRGPGVRSLLIEVNQNLPDHMSMVRELNALGFRHDPGQVRRAERQSGAFEGCAEYVFVR